ncbi:MAG TPA: hypothetical protein VGM44_05355 [Polyangiaceae bacterium]|jgi:hypothetical protein
MTNKRNPEDVSFFHQRGEGDDPSTLRSIEVADEIAAEVEDLQQPVYVEPQPPARISDHKTIEIETVKLAEDIDPRKLPTELRLARPPSFAPDSGALHDLGLVSSQTPPVRRVRWRVPAVLAALLAALILLALARSAARSRATQAAAEPVQSAQTELVTTTRNAEPAPPAAALEPAPNPEPAPSAPTAIEDAPAASNAESVLPSAPEVGTKKHSHSHSIQKSSAQPAAGANPRAADTAGGTQPKRAIY